MKQQNQNLCVRLNTNPEQLTATKQKNMAAIWTQTQTETKETQ